MNSINEFLIHYGYLLVFSVVLGEKLGLPLPSGTLLILAGALAGGRELNFTVLFLLAVIACLMSDQTWYQFGRHRGGSLLPSLCRISLNPDSCVRRTQNIFYRHGAKSLLVVKFFPGVNALAAPLSGILRMTLFRFLLFDFLGSCLWVGVFTSLGYLLSDEIELVVAYVSRVGVFLWGLIIFILLLYMVGHYVQRQRIAHQLHMARISPEELKQKMEASEELLILDVRNPIEFNNDPQMIPGALYLPLEKFQENPPDFYSGREVILYCD
jgi:membrane protein DedA with SNARE-associated domain